MDGSLLTHVGSLGFAARRPPPGCLRDNGNSACVSPPLCPQVPGNPDDALLLRGCCRARAEPAEWLALLKPLWAEALAKRSFRNGVGTGLRKTPFPRSAP